MKFILAAGLNVYENWNHLQISALKAEGLGFWGFSLPDHFMITEDQFEKPKVRMWAAKTSGNSTIDSWAALLYLAAKTKKIHLGTLVTPIPLRPPSILAKVVATGDLLSNGRTFLGVGAGWSRIEFEGFSKWDSAKIRVTKTEEGLDLIVRLWTQKSVDFNGKYYRAKGAVLEPKPVQKPYPPLVFGGVGNRMLRMAGRYASICLIPAFHNVDNARARNLVLDEARKNHRENAIAIADMAPFPPSEFSYNNKDYLGLIEQAVENGSEYFVTPFPAKNFQRRLGNFARDVMPSFNS